MRSRWLAGIVALSCVPAAFPPAACAQTPAWSVTPMVTPANLPLEGTGVIDLIVANRGDTRAEGGAAPVVVHDELPAGVTASAISIEPSYQTGKEGTGSCVLATLTCEYPQAVAPYGSLLVEVEVAVSKGAVTGEINRATVSGGGAGSATAADALTISSAPPSFGVERFSLTPESEDGAIDTAAGSHPFQLTTTIDLDRTFNKNGEPTPIAYEKDLSFKLPPGLVGDAQAVPQCTVEQFSTISKVTAIDECAADNAIGVATVVEKAGGVFTVPVFNLVPARGEPARFGFLIADVPVYLDTSVRTGEDYGVTVDVNNISQDVPVTATQLTLWGVPGDPRHDSSRGWSCLLEGNAPIFNEGPCEEVKLPQRPFLTMPVSCQEQMRTTVVADSWIEPTHKLSAEYLLHEEGGQALRMGGCERLDFDPSMSVTPDGQNASSATGMTVNVHVPQEVSLNPTGRAESDVRSTTMALPLGVTLNPGGAGGLAACGEAEVGYHGDEAPGEVATEAFSATLPEPFCPSASKLGTVEIQTPLLPNALKGAVYLGTPAPTGEAGQNPFRSLVTMYIVVEDPISGTLIKLPGKTTLCQSAGEHVGGLECEGPGQVIAVFEGTPQLPFEDLTLHFFGGGRAPLATPGLCGSYAAKALFTPWSGDVPVPSTSTFEITHGPNGTACPSSPLPFTPEFNTGTTNINAGSYSELRTTMGHPDVDQALGALKMTLPPGVMGTLAHVKLCPEPQANAGTCGPESLVGETTVTAGLGSTPAVVARPGRVYITGPYNGHGACKVGEAGCAPYGLSIANPAETGPFDLEKGTACDCIVVRAKVEVDPHTAQLEITSDPLPTMLKGIPLDLQHVAVQINRPDFTFNPTSCDRMKITGTLSGAEGAASPISEPFQVANCERLPFKPTFEAFTKAHHTRLKGAYLHVVVKAKQGQANIKEVKVKLPRAMPSELKTLQQACTEGQFAKDPAGCPAGSVVGHAIVHTPVLPVPLKGPAYFVSHGGKRFPELVMVLQGYGVTVQLNGETFISKKGVTTSTFRTVPDVPFNRFDLVLPMKKGDSALGGTANFCERKLVMPTRIVAQSGKLIEHDTKIQVEGCKPVLYLRGRKTRGAKATLRVQVPYGGKLSVHGKGVIGSAKHRDKAGVIAIKVHLKPKVRSRLAHGKRRSTRVRVQLSFRSKHHKQLHKTVRLRLG